MARAFLRDRRWQLGLALVVLAIAWSARRAMLGPQVPAYRVARQDLVARVGASGRVMSPPLITLAARRLAQVVDVPVEEGDRVAAGQLLVELDDAGGARLVAPAPAIVVARAVEPGDVVTAGKPLLVLSRIGDVRLTVQADQRDLSLLRAGQPALAVADAFPARAFLAEVSLVAPSLDAARGTVEVRLRVADPPEFLRADMTVSVSVEVARRPAVLVVPADAVRDPHEPWVMLVRDGRTERRPVTLGLRGEGTVEVVRGLAEGDEVVPATVQALTPGQRVRVRLVPLAEAAHA